jgi:hypothetical protein
MPVHERWHRSYHDQHQNELINSLQTGPQLTKDNSYLTSEHLSGYFIPYMSAVLEALSSLYTASILSM